MRTKESFSVAEARRIALAAQGFAAQRPQTPQRRHLLKLIDDLGVIQIDSVNVLSRSHYLPLLARLGPYPRSLLDEAAWGERPALFEYWAHEASLTPLALQPLLRWRMEDAAAGTGVWRNLARFLRERQDFLADVLAEVAERGPLAASQLERGEKGSGGWWGWSEAKVAVEALFATGQLSVAGRRGSFERLYDLTERVLPRQTLATPAPPVEEAHRRLLSRAGRALGIATERDLRDYFRMGSNQAKPRIVELVDAGELLPVTVKGWSEPSYLHRLARLPRRVETAALLSPFDNLIWFRDRAEHLFDLHYRIELYTPSARRVHGYYVLPLLQDQAITARLDLKADRKAGALLVHASHSEAEANAETPAAAAQALREMAGWLGLERVLVSRKGALAERLEALLVD